MIGTVEIKQDNVAKKFDSEKIGAGKGDNAQKVLDLLMQLRKKVEESTILSRLKLNNGSNIFLVCFAVFFLYGFLRTTVIPLPVILITMMKYSAPAFGLIIWFKILVFDVNTKRDLVNVVLLQMLGMVVAIYATNIGELDNLTVYWLMIIGARNVDFRRIARLALLISVPVLVAVTLLSVTGVITDLVYFPDISPRHSFGIIYPTDYAAHWFFAASLWFWLKNGRLKWYEISVFIALTAFLFVFCKPRLDCICMLLLTAAGLLLNYKWTEKSVLRLRWTFVAVFLFFAAAAFILSIIYSPGLPLREYLNARFHTIHSRFRIAYEMLCNYPFSFFGASFCEIGNGGSTVEPSKSQYSFIDISYIKVYIRAGVIIFAGLMFLLTRFMYKRAKAKDAATLVVMSIIAMNCFVAHHLLDFSYNVFLLMLFAGVEFESAKLKKKEQENE